MMRNVVRLSVIGVSVLLISGCQSLPSQLGQSFSAAAYEGDSEDFSKSFNCNSTAPQKYPGFLEISSLETAQNFSAIGLQQGGVSYLKGQNCKILNDAYKTCSLSSSLNECAAGYTFVSNNYQAIKQERDAEKQIQAKERQAKEQVERLQAQERKKQHDEQMKIINNALAREAELKSQLAWTSNALNERKLKLVNINPKSKEYTAINNEIKVLEEQLPPLRNVVKLIDDYKVALENEKQQRIAEEQQRQINVQNARQQMYQQQALEQQRAMQENLYRQQMMNNIQNSLNALNPRTLNCTTSGIGNTLYTNCR